MLGKPHPTAGDLDEAVTGQRTYGLGIELAQASWSLGDEAQRAPAALPEGTLESALLAKRRITAAA